jgi:Cu+-exporting ATPase
MDQKMPGPAGSCCGGGQGRAGHGQSRGHDHGHQHDHGADVEGENRVKDPVCGMWVDPHTAEHRAEHNGQPFYFCSAGCREKFLADPARYRSL